MVDALPYLIGLSVRLHRADAQPLPAHRHHAEGAPADGAEPQGDPAEADQPQRAGDRQRPEARRDWMYRGGYMSRATARVKEPVFDAAALRDMVKDGISRLAEHADAPTAAGAGSAAGASNHGRTPPRTSSTACRSPAPATWRCCPDMIERGLDWLQRYQAEQIQLIQQRREEGEGRPLEGARRQPRRLRLHGPRRRGREVRQPRDARLSSIATATNWPSTPRPCSAWRCTSSATSRSATCSCATLTSSSCRTTRTRPRT